MKRLWTSLAIGFLGAAALVALDWLLHFMLWPGASLALTALMVLMFGAVSVVLVYFAQAGNRAAVVAWLVFGLVWGLGHFLRPAWVVTDGVRNLAHRVGEQRIVDEARALAAPGKVRTIYSSVDLPPALGALSPVVVKVDPSEVRIKVYSLALSDFNGFVVPTEQGRVSASGIKIAEGLYWYAEPSWAGRVL